MIYARSDIRNVSVSPAHGGCGQTHTRPEGEQLWGLECPACQVFLLKDPLWCAEPEDLPETFDEQRRREGLEKNATARNLRVTETAAAMLALMAGPRDLLAGVTPQLAPAAECRKCGAGVTAGARFCVRCGSPVLREIGGVA